MMLSMLKNDKEGKLGTTPFCTVFAVCKYRLWLVLGLTKVDVMGIGTENELQIQEGVTKFIITSYDTVNNDMMTRIL